MTESPDLLGYTPAQGSLFGEEANRMDSPKRTTTPDPAFIRRRLQDLVETARAAQAMPWSERDARMWRTVVPNMTKWLPQDKAARIRETFEQEMRRLTEAA